MCTWSTSQSVELDAARAAHFSTLSVKVRHLLRYGDVPRTAGVDWHGDNGVAVDGLTWHQHLSISGSAGNGGGRSNDGDGTVEGRSDDLTETLEGSDSLEGSTVTNTTVRPSIVLDVRNMYESDLGRFERAISLDTETFSETWDALDRVLEDVPKDTAIYMYVTQRWLKRSVDPMLAH